MNLSPKHKEFADAYIQSRNASEAYRIAYGNKKESVVNSAASRLLRNVKIRNYLVKVQTEKLTKTAEKQDITRDFLIQQYLTVYEKATEQSSTLSVAKATLDSLAHISGLWLDKRTVEVSGAVNHLASLDTSALLDALGTARRNDGTTNGTIDGEYRNVDD
jgi:hypothetical protein